MPIDHGRDPWSGTTYKGFAGGPAGHPAPPADSPGATPVAQPLRRRRPMRALVAAGVFAALALGVAFGFWARPQLIGAGPAVKTPALPGQSAPTRPPGAAQVPIAVAPAPRTAASASPAPQGRLETLPPEMAAAERAPARPHEVGETAGQASPTEPEIESPPPAASAPVESPAAHAAAPAAQGVQARASFDCATARPGAEQMVCADPELAAADRQMAQAYRRALRSGVDPADLRQEQRDFLAIREDAARHSRRALAQVYDQRIQDLNQTADEGADDGPDDDR